MAHAVNPDAGRTQLLSGSDIVYRYRWQFRRYLLEFLYLYSGHTGELQGNSGSQPLYDAGPFHVLLPGGTRSPDVTRRG